MSLPVSPIVPWLRELFSTKLSLYFSVLRASSSGHSLSYTETCSDFGSLILILLILLSTCSSPRSKVTDRRSCISSSDSSLDTPIVLSICENLCDLHVWRMPGCLLSPILGWLYTTILGLLKPEDWAEIWLSSVIYSLARDWPWVSLAIWISAPIRTFWPPLNPLPIGGFYAFLEVDGRYL
jgi:hypothetical protein